MEEEEEPMELVALEDLRSWYAVASAELHEFANVELPFFDLESRQADLVYNKALGIDHAVGDVFYPCAGRDHETVVDLFGEVSDRIILADPYIPRGGRGTPRVTSIDHIRQVAVRDEERPPFRHQMVEQYTQDGLVVFCRNVEKLAVFFYRGDSTGEGGSNQWWLGETLFIAIVLSLPEKGLIVTDGSNSGFLDKVLGRYVPWNALDGIAPCEPPKVGNSFTWEHLRFDCVAGPLKGGNANRGTFVWQVDSVTESTRR